MFRNLDKQSLVGILLTVVMLGAGAWFLLGRDNNGGMGGIIGESDSGPTYILRDELNNELQKRQQGLLITNSGKGQLGNGVGWQFDQSQSTSGGEIVDENGNRYPERIVTEGNGARLVLSGVQDVSSAQDALRRTLSDDQVVLSGQPGNLAMSSRYIVAGKPILQANSLTLQGLFLRARCSSQDQGGEEVLQASCRETKK